MNNKRTHKTVKTLLGPFLGLLMCYTFMNAQKLPTMKSRMNREKLNVGTYFLQKYASSEAHVKDLAACGIDFVVCMRNDRTTLDLFSKYHVGAVVTDVLPHWWGGDGNNAGQLAKKYPLTNCDKAAKGFRDHPAIWGIDIGDEPSALDFPFYGKIYSRVNKLFPHQFPYLNLYPNYASVSENSAQQTTSQLGTTSYTEHIAQYCKNVPADYICYDFYLYSINVPSAYENLRVVSDACIGTKRSMWIVLQVNSKDEKQWISENELRFQAYTAMAFGAENIIWACYTAGWWNNQVLDDKGNKTQQYDKLKKVNAEIHLLGNEYMKYRRTATTFVGFEGTDWLKNVKQTSYASLNNGVFTDVCAEDGSPLVIGSMVSRSGNGNSALFICSADDPYDKAPKQHIVRFKADNNKIIKAYSGSGEINAKLENGYYTIPIASNGGIVVEANVK